MMRKLLIALVAVCAMVLTGCTNERRDYVIKGEVEGLPDGTILTLKPMSHDNDSVMMESVVTDGKFRFRGMALEPICAMISVKDSYGCGYVMLENTDMEVKATVTRDTTNTHGDIYQWKMEVSGSPLTDKLKAFDAKHDSLDLLYQEMQEKHGDAFNKMHSLQGAALEAFKKTPEYQAAVDGEKQFFDTVEKTIMGMVNENKDNFWGPLLMVKYMSYLTKKDADIYHSFPEEVKNSFYGKKMEMEIWPEKAVAPVVKEFVIKTDDKELNFEKLAEGKKYVLLDFWASWCGPCRREIPNVKKAYELFKDKGFEVVSISIDEKEADWKKALDEEKLPWPNFRDKAVADQFMVKSVPTVYLCDAEGNIVAANEELRGEGLANKLAELLK